MTEDEFTAYQSLGEDTEDHRWAFGTGFTDPLEGIAASVALLARAAAGDLGAPLTSLRVDGGLTRSRLLMQAQADLLQLPVLICRAPDATALGVAALARLGAGEASSAGEALGPAEVETIIEPAITADEAAVRMMAFETALGLTLARR